MYLSRLSKSKTLFLDFPLWNWLEGGSDIFEVMHYGRGKKKQLSVEAAKYSQSYKCFIIIIKNQSELMIFLKFPGKITSCSLKYLGNIPMFWAHWRVKRIASFLSWFYGRQSNLLCFWGWYYHFFKVII